MPIIPDMTKIVGNTRKSIFDPVKIRRARSLKGMGLAQVARKCKLSESSVWRTENGQRSNAATIVKIAKALGVSPESFEYGYEEKKGA